MNQLTILMKVHMTVQSIIMLKTNYTLLHFINEPVQLWQPYAHRPNGETYRSVKIPELFPPLPFRSKHHHIQKLPLGLKCGACIYIVKSKGGSYWGNQTRKHTALLLLFLFVYMSQKPLVYTPCRGNDKMGQDRFTIT